VAEPAHVSETRESAARDRTSEPGVLRTLLVGLAVCGVCAAVVTATIVVLRPLQVENQRRDREARIGALVLSLPGVAELVREAGAVALDLRAVELATGEFAASVDAESLVRQGELADQGTPLAPERDLAGLGAAPRYAPVYLLRRGEALHTVILPVRGLGHVAMMHGYLALAPDGETVRGLTFTEHEETPGLGAEIANPQWQARWRDKRLRDAAGELRIRVVRSGADASSPYDVHGISGATRTGDGVTAMIRFWVGPDGFGPFLDRLHQGGDS
jgi:Na+-transporting NADH:ubiquinone oxidoreductase subunit C